MANKQITEELQHVISGLSSACTSVKSLRAAFNKRDIEGIEMAFLGLETAIPSWRNQLIALNKRLTEIKSQI